MTKLDARLKIIIDRVRRMWLAIMAVSTVLTLAYMPWWCLILLIPFAFVAYFALLYATISFVAATVSPEEIAEAEAQNKVSEEDQARFDAVEKIATRQAAGEKIPDAEIIETLNSVGITDIVKVDDLGPVVGTYRDKNIYEYVHIQMPKDAERSKLLYHGPANIVNGVAELPVNDGMIFAIVDNIVYAKEVK